MKSIYISFITIACFSVLVLTSCESHEQTADDAYESVKKEKMLPKDSKQLVQNILKMEAAKKCDPIIDEWTLYKTDIEKKIIINEIKIKELKGIPNTNAKTLKQVTRIEKDNNDLRIQIDQYNEEGKARWIKFKAKMKQDLDDLNSAFNDLAPKK